MGYAIKVSQIALAGILGSSLLLAGCGQESTQTPEAQVPEREAPESQAPEKQAPAYNVSITLGDTATLTTLFSYPNADNGETLEQTIEHYLTQRVERDLITNGSVDVTVANDTYTATISGDSESVNDYQGQITTFLQNGTLAAKAVTELKAAGKWNDDEWRMFLPLGLSIVNQRSVQLLHFPPDYSLPDQDYLNSKTSQRWEKLLELNSVASEDVTLYESILDVAPIAAPASAGSSLSDTYSYFEPYVLQQLPLLLDVDEGKSALPIVAYGGPVRSWVSEYYKLQDFGVNSYNTISITDSETAPILGANHPSYIWYAKEDGRDAAMKVMQQDLVSACWQASMGANPGQHGDQVLQDCTTYWQGQPMTVCVNMEIQAYDKTEAEAKAICESDMPTPKAEIVASDL
jgi:hypothetical protein